jgi:hypothetical protein
MTHHITATYAYAINADTGRDKPTGESQWQSKSKVLLRNVRRLLHQPTRAAFKSWSEASTPLKTWPPICPQ